MNHLVFKQRESIFIIILSALMAVNSLATDAYLPAMPAMEASLGKGAELTITGYLLGFMLAQLVWGPISDRVGRIKPLLIGSSIFVIGTIACATSTSMTELVIWRILQAFGACVGPMLSRAMIRDAYSTQEGVSKLSTLTMVMAVFPILGPLIGGAIVANYTWNYVFYAIAAVGLVIGISVLSLPETLPVDKRDDTLTFTSVWSAYWKLINNINYMKYVLCLMFFYMAAYAVIAGTPSVYITFFGIPEQYYGLIFGLNIVGIFGISYFNKRLTKRYAIDDLIHYAGLYSLIWAIIMVVCAYYNLFGILGIVLPIFMIFSMNGIIAACCTGAALAEVPDQVGMAAALLGSLQYGSGIVSSLALAYMPNDTPMSLSIIVCICVVLSIAVAYMNKRDAA